MRSKVTLAVLGAAALLASFVGGAGAQTQTPPIAPPLHGRPRMGDMQGRMGQMPGIGAIVGNRKTKVYHLAGDRGNMPVAKNRVFFRSEREAIAAGYHRAGIKRIRGPVLHVPPRGAIRPMGGHLPR